MSFDYEKVENAPISPDGPISAEEKWNRLKYFLERTIPVAGEFNVKLAVHPDDPPAPVLGGIARILNSVDGLQRVIDTFPSDCVGLDFCQGTISEFPGVGPKVVDAIRHFGKQKKIFYAHFRNLKGTYPKYDEVFSDDGDVNMFEAMKAYKEVGFNGVIRPDHTPIVVGDEQCESPYVGKRIGQAFAIGYMRALIQAVNHNGMGI